MDTTRSTPLFQFPICVIRRHFSLWCMMETVRLRVLFRDKDLLTESLSKEGLSRSWIVLKSHLRTISDLSSYILSVFRLQDACPCGLILSVRSLFHQVTLLKDCLRMKVVEVNEISYASSTSLIKLYLQVFCR